MPESNVPFYLLYPLNWQYQITGRFNDPRQYTFARNKLQKHEGIDFAPIGGIDTPKSVLAAQRGVVSKVGVNPEGYGNYVRIDHDWHDGRWVTWYGHLSATTVREGQFVQAGDIIGAVGSTGFSSGPHLHLTVQHIGHGLSNYVVDDVVNPEPLLRQTAVEFNEAGWVADVTVADGTQMQPGQQFVKTWRIRNSGTQAWESGYTFAFFRGDQMRGPQSIPLPTIAPGETVDLSMTLIAPSAPGTYVGVWKPQDAGGNFFPHEQWVEIVVPQREDTPRGTDEAGWVADVTIEDGTEMQPGESFTKTWRIRNQGTTAWGQGYTFVFFSGERMGGPQNISLPPAQPGEEINVSIPLTAPATPGTYRGVWKPRNAQGNFFDHEQWVEIKVAAQFLVGAGSISSDGFALSAGKAFIKSWRVRNTGPIPWDHNVMLSFVSGNRMSAPEIIALPNVVRPGEEADLMIAFTAPDTAGWHRGTWRLRGPRGVHFGPELVVEILVT